MFKRLIKWLDQPVEFTNTECFILYCSVICFVFIAIILTKYIPPMA